MILFILRFVKHPVYPISIIVNNLKRNLLYLLVYATVSVSHVSYVIQQFAVTLVVS